MSRYNLSLNEYNSGGPLKIHEYQGKEILRKFGVAVPQGRVATTAEEAAKTAQELGGGIVVVKAQIHAGGRGKGGGIKLAKNPDEAYEIAKSMIGMQLVTHQTGTEGKRVNKVLVEQGLSIARELYVGIVLDRAVSQLVMMASTEGGVEIEKVAAETPEKILKEYIDPLTGLRPAQARKLAFGLGLEGEAFKNAVKFFQALYKAYVESDCSLAEINPLVVTTEGQVLALDAKINFDDNALYRHPEYAGLRDLSEEEPLEVEASKYHLNYIKLDGEVGCMVNGAGLAMATMDIIKLAGSSPANFLDVGGGASAETVENGFRILLSDKNLKAVLINVFGGIVRCDRIANGVIQAAKNVQINVPLVVRLEGTNAEEAARLLNESGLPLIVAGNLKDAAEKVVAAIRA
jgi:succinyl-CoA synthetase beta subunit